MSKAISLGTYKKLRILAPFVHNSKSEIVVRGAKLGINFEKTWSCYKGQKAHCGKCGACIERREAFAISGISDPTTYMVR